MKNSIRDTWPKIRTAEIKGERLYVVDARRANFTGGRREYFSKLEDARKRATSIAADFAATGNQGNAIPLQLRAMAEQGQDILKPYGKTILDACQFYRDWLKGEQDKEASALIPKLAAEWFKDKQDPKHKLKAPTLRAIRQTSNLLIKECMGVRIKSFTKGDAEKLVFKQQGEYQQEGTRNRCGQFFNWCITKDYTTTNPFSSKLVTVTLPEADIEIFDSATTQKVLELCEDKHKDILVFTAICFFAGLRPGEAEQLTWENIHLEEKTIHVLGSTSKAKVTHNVDIEDNLIAWLEQYRPEGAKGPICPTGKTLARKRAALHADLGYKADGRNPNAKEITQDVMRHSYASHWQAKYTNAHKLAEQMANSVEVIRNHYKKVVSKAEIVAFWSILPEIANRKAGETVFVLADRKQARAKRLAKAFAGVSEGQTAV